MAISFAGNTVHSGGGSSSYTFAHNVGTGSNRLLIVQARALNTGPNTYLGASGVTYNGVAMTFIGNVGTTGYGTSFWYLIAPATGSNNVVVTYSTSSNHTVKLDAISFDGVHQTTAIGDTGTDTFTADTTVSVTLTDLYTNSWVFGGSSAEAGATPFTATVDNTSVYNINFFSVFFQTVSGSYNSNAATTDTDTATHTFSASCDGGLVAFEIRSADGALRLGLSENIKMTPTVLKQLAKSFSENIAMATTLIKSLIFPKDFTENMKLTSSIAKKIFMNITENITLAPIFTTLTGKALTASVSLTSSINNIFVTLLELTANLALKSYFRIIKDGIRQGLWTKSDKKSASWTEVVKKVVTWNKTNKQI